ncbi:MAG: hypothetical protein IT385_26595 [Deltaproteobacteria bacterium]|nr:hypothetical protein [Deltaproteobacteria bacterium]
MPSMLEQVSGELAKNPTDADAVQRFAERCLERADGATLRHGLEPTLAEVMGPLAVRPVAQALARALTRAAERAPTPLDAVELHLRAARVLAQIATDRLGAARSLAAAWRIAPDERVATLAQGLFQGTAEVPEYTLAALANVGQGEPRLQAMRRLAATALERRKLDAAEALFTRLSELMPSDVDAAAGHAAIARMRADADKRIRALEAELQRASAAERAPLLRALGDAHRSAGRRDAAEAAWRQAVALGDESALRALEQMLREAGRLDALVALWEERLPTLPRERQLALRRRLHHLVHDELGRRDDAKRLLGQVARAAQPVDHAPTAEAARALEGKELLRDAATMWEEVATHTAERDGKVRALENAARLLVELGEDAGAERCYRKVRALEPHSRAALDFFREHYKENDDPRRAFNNLAQLHALEPRRDARQALAQEMARLGEAALQSPDKAVEAFKLLEKDLPPGADPLPIWAQMKRLYAAAGRWHAYVDLLERWIQRVDPGQTAATIELLFDIVDVYQDPAKLPMPAMVLQTYQRIVALSPTHEKALDQLAVGLEAREQWADLVPVLSQKIELTHDPAELVPLFVRVAEIYLDHIRSESQAIMVLERLLELQPDDIEVVRRLRELHRRRHDSAELYKTLTRELALTDPNAQVDRIRILSDLGHLAGHELLDPDAAIAHWREVLTLDPQNGKALEALQTLHAEVADWPAFVKVLEQRVADAKTKAAKLPLLLELGEALYTRLGDVEAAEKIFQSIAETTPTSATARRFLQRIFVSRRKWPELARLFTGKSGKSAGAGPPAARWKEYVALLRDAAKHEADPALVADIQVELAHVLEGQLDDKKGALEALEAALRVAEHRTELAYRAQALIPEDAPGQRRLVVLGAIARHSPDAAERHQSWLAIALIHRRAKDAVQATEAWGRALVAGAELGLAEALGGLEEEAGTSGRWEQAYQAIDEALGRLPADALAARVAFHRALGNIARARLLAPDDAIRHFKWVLQLRPGEPFALEELEKIHFSRNDFAGLEEVYKARLDAAVAAGATDEQVQSGFKLARLYEDVLLDPERAAQSFQDILRLAPGDEEALAGLVRSLETQGAWGELAASLEAILTRLPDASPARRAAIDLRLAEIHAERLAEPLIAVEHARAGLDGDADGPAAPDAVALLERLVQVPSLRADVSPLLEATYRRRKELDKLAHLLEARLDDAPREDLPGLLDELAMLAAGALDAPDKAFEALLRRFRLTPDEADVWSELERAAHNLRSITAWETVASAYLAVVGPPRASGAGRPEGPLRPALRLRLAEVYHRRLIELEDAIAQTETAIDESADEDEQLRAFESLEILYKKAADLDGFVRVKLEASRRVISRALRRQKVCEAAQALAGALGRPGDAIAILEPLWREDPADGETFDQIVQILDKAGDWPRLERYFDEAIAAARDGARRDALAYRRAIIRRDRLGQWEAAISDLIDLVPSPTEGERARSSLLEVSRARESEGQRDVILEVLEGYYRDRRDLEGLLTVLLVTAEFASPGADKARVLREAAMVAVPQSLPLAEHPDRAAHALDLYLQALVEHPADADALEAMSDLARRASLWPEYADALRVAAESAGRTSAARGLWRAEAVAAETELGDAERAVTCWQEDLALGEALDEADVDLALDALDRLHLERNDVDARLQVLRKKDARAGDPLERATIVEEIARLELETGQEADAIASLERALDELGRTHRAKTRAQRQRVRGTLESVLAHAGRHQDLVEVLVQAANTEEEPNEKRELLHRAAELSADTLGDDDRAIVLYERLVERDGADEAAIARLVALYARTERWADCVAALGRQRAMAEQAGAEVEARELSFSIGEILADRLGEISAAVTMFGRVLRGDPSHAGALAALARYEDDDAGVATEARALLAEAHRTRGEHGPLARVLGLAVAAGEATPAILRELAELWLGPLREPHRAWPHAAMGYLEDPLGPDGEACRRALLELGRGAIAEGEGSRRLVDALIEVHDALPEGGQRLERKRADLKAVMALGAAPADRVPLWRSLLIDDPNDAIVIEAFESHARQILAEAGPALLVEALTAKVRATDPMARIPIEVELARLLGRMPGSEAEAIGVLVSVLAREPERVDAVDALAGLYAATARHAERAALYEDQLARSPAPARAAELRRALAKTWWTHLGEPARAVALLGEMLKADPADADAAETLEAIWGEGAERPAIYRILEPRYQALADWDKLVALYTSTLEQDDHDLQIECLSKLAELERAQLDKPEAAFTTLLALVERLDADPVETRAHLDALEGLAQRLGRWDELVEQLEALVALGQGGWPLMARLGRIHDRARSDPERAAYFYGFAYERAPEDTATRDALAELLERTERWDELQRHLLGAVEHAADIDERAKLRRRAARALDERLGRPQHAVEVLEALIAEAGRAPAPAGSARVALVTEAHEACVAVLERIQDFEALHAHLRRWLEQAPSDDVAVDLQVRLGRSLVRFPETAREGLTELEEVLRTAPERRDVVPTLWSMLTTCDKLEAGGEEVDWTYAEATADAARLLEDVLGQAAPPAMLAGIVQAQLRVLPSGEERRQTLLRLAALERDLDRTDRAFAHYAEALKSALGDQAIETDLEELAARADLWTDLSQLYEECTADPDHEARYGLKLAHILRTRLGRAADAAGWYERHLGLAPGSREALEPLAAHYQEARDAVAEARILETWIAYSATKDELPTLRLRLGILRMDQLGDAQGAIDALEGCLPEGAADAELVRRLERLYVRGNHFQALVELYQSAIAFIPPTGPDARPKEHLEILAKMAQVHETRLADLASARDVCRRMLAIEPLHRFALTALERIERQLGDWDAVDEVLGKKLQAAPSDEARAKILIDRADVATHHRQRMDEALEHLLLADKLVGPGPGPDELIKGFEGLLRGEAQARLMAARSLQKRYRARQSWTSLINVLLLELVASGSPEERLQLAQQAFEIATERLRDRLLALRVLLAALRQSPQTAALRELVTQTASEVGEWGMVIRTGEETLKRVDDPADIRSFGLWLGAIVRQHGTQAAAVKILERVLEVAPGDPEASDHLAVLYRDRGDWGALRGLYTERIATAPEDERPRLELEMMLDLADAPEAGGLEAAVAAVARHLAAHPSDARLVPALRARLAQDAPGALATEVLARRLEQEQAWEELVALYRARAEHAREHERGRVLAAAATVLEDRLGRPDEAVSELTRAVRSTPDDRALWARLRALGASTGAFARIAHPIATELPRVTDRDLSRELSLALAEVQADKLGDARAAAKTLQSAITRDATDLEARERLLACWRKLGDVDAFERDVTTLAALLEPVESRPLWTALRAFADEVGDERRAIVADEALLGIDPEDVEAAEHLTTLYRRAGRMEDLSDLLFLRIQASHDDPTLGARFWAELAELRAGPLGDRPGADDAWLEAFNLDAGHPLAAAQVFAAAEAREDWTRAAEVLALHASALEPGKKRVETWARAARLYEDKVHAPTEAATAWEAVLEDDGDNLEAMTALIALYGRARRFDELAAMLELKAEHLSGHERHLTEVQAAAIHLDQRQDVERARGLIDRVMRDEPKQLEARLLLSRLHARTGDARLAAATLATLAEEVEGKRKARILMDLARLESAELGELKQATLHAQAAWAIDKTVPGLDQLVVTTLTRAEDWRTLAAHLEVMYAIARTPMQRVQHALELARLHLGPLADGDSTQVERWLDEARRYDPQNLDILLVEAELARARNDLESAESKLAEAVVQLQDRKLTEQVVRRAHELGIVRERLGRRDQALESYARAHELDGKYLPNLLSYGHALIAARRWPEALSIHQALLLQRTAVTDEAERHGVLERLALASWEVGQRERARQYLQRLLSERPDHQGALALKRRFTAAG